MSESSYTRYQTARGAGISSKDYAKILQKIDEKKKEREGKSVSQADVKAVLKQSRLTAKQKRAIWDSYGWKTKSPW